MIFYSPFSMVELQQSTQVYSVHLQKWSKSEQTRTPSGAPHCPQVEVWSWHNCQFKSCHSLSHHLQTLHIATCCMCCPRRVMEQCREACEHHCTSVSHPGWSKSALWHFYDPSRPARDLCRPNVKIQCKHVKSWAKNPYHRYTSEIWIKYVYPGFENQENFKSFLVTSSYTASSSSKYPLFLSL